jgi:hypothetical protein
MEQTEKTDQLDDKALRDEVVARFDVAVQKRRVLLVEKRDPTCAFHRKLNRTSVRRSKDRSFR